jgi:hypothetical protein
MVMVSDDALLLVECVEAAEPARCGYRLYAECLIEQAWTT